METQNYLDKKDFIRASLFLQGDFSDVSVAALPSPTDRGESVSPG